MKCCKMSRKTKIYVTNLKIHQKKYGLQKIKENLDFKLGP